MYIRKAQHCPTILFGSYEIFQSTYIESHIPLPHTYYSFFFNAQ